MKQRQAPQKTKLIREPIPHFFKDNITNANLPEEIQGKALFTAYSTDDGLALDQIYCSYLDSRGNLWFGTNGGGVSKYDGKTFKTINNQQGLASNVIWCIQEDKQKNIWFATDGNGVSKFDGKIFTNYTTANGLAGDIVFVIKEDQKGNLWFGTSNGVSKYDGKQFTKVPLSPDASNIPVKDMLLDNKGNFWFATLGAGAIRLSGKNMTTFASPNSILSDTIRSLFQDNMGNIWFGTNGDGIIKFNGSTFKKHTIQDGLASNKVMTIKGDTKGNIWVGTNGGGVSKYDGKQFINYTVGQGLISNRVPSITEDNHGNMWFGTFGGGIIKFCGNGFSNYTIQQGLPNSTVYSMTEDAKGHLWIGTFGGGVSRYDRISFMNYGQAQGFKNATIYCTATDSKGNLWFGTYEGGVVKFDGSYFTTYTKEQGLAGDIVFSIREDRKGNIWFGTSSGGVSKFDGESFTNYNKNQGLHSNGIFSITEDSQGNLWFGTYGGGITKFDGSRFTNLNSTQGLADNTVWAITEDASNNLWFGTQQGLSMLPKESISYLTKSYKADTLINAHLFQTFTTKDGLPDNFVTQILTSKNQTLYIGTNQGICELLPDNGRDASIKRWHVGKVYNTATGYPIKDVNAGQGGMYLDRKGIIWIGTGSEKSGLVRFDPQAFNTQSAKPSKVVLNHIKIDNENIVWNDFDTTAFNKPAAVVEEINLFGRMLSLEERNIQREKFGQLRFDSVSKWNPIPHGLVLPYEHNSIGFEFNAVQVDKNELVKYQYLLEGYDKSWSPWNNTTNASFGNIDEGTYTFKVKAQNLDGVVSETLQYTFKVLPPLWRTWWMYVIYLVISFSFIVFIFRWNNKRILEQKKMLEHKVTIATRQIREEKENAEEQKQLVEQTLHQLQSTQAQLVQAEKMASLGELTAGIAHEIQNPLNFVNNFSEVSTELIDEMHKEMEQGHLEEVKEIASDLKLNLEKINQHGKRAGDIVRGMLQHSRSNSGQKELTDINTLCDEYLRLAYHGLRAKDKSFNAHFEMVPNQSIPQIKVNQQEIGRVILNLISNAFYSVNERKKSGETDYTPTVKVVTYLRNNLINIQVQDNGMGVPETVQQKIFQPFFTTKPTGEGTGLGLSMSYDIIKSHGGTIQLESREKQGAIFTISLPTA